MADISSMSTSDLISSLGSGSAPVNNPDTFSASYGPAAVAAGKALGVDPHLLLGQWGLETGWGKSVIPGTNNLGNIKDPSGKGPSATDNVTGSTDSYRSFSSPMQFAQGYVNLIKNKYPQVVGTGSNAQAFFSGLKAGG